jgi:hypothetical protein
MEAVPYDMDMPKPRRHAPNPDRLRANIPALERLLDHNTGARVVCAHAGWDLTGERTVALMRTLLGRHSNLFMSIKVDRTGAQRSSPFARDGTLREDWVALMQDFPDRFIIGSDQFHDEETTRLELARQLIDALPPAIASRVARENALAIYRLGVRK